MKQPQSHQQLSNRKGVSDVFVYLMIILIAAFSGLIVYLMANTLINDYILRTLGVRLTLHGLSTYYNTLYTMPSGRAEFTATFPPQCELKCIDCGEIEIPFMPFPDIECNCENGVREEPNVLNTIADEQQLVCDDYIIEDIEPVMLFNGLDAVGAGIKVVMKIYPETDLFKAFTDTLLTEAGSIVGVDLPFFRSDITVFSEMPLNLNDYAGVRRLLTTAPEQRFSEILLWDEGEDITLKKRTYGTTDSVVGEGTDSYGLTGLVSLLLNHTSNKTVTDLTGDGLINDNDYIQYCDISYENGDPFPCTGVNAPVIGCQAAKYYCQTNVDLCVGVDNPVTGCAPGLNYVLVTDLHDSIYECLPEKGVLCPARSKTAGWCAAPNNPVVGCALGLIYYANHGSIAACTALNNPVTGCNVGLSYFTAGGGFITPCASTNVPVTGCALNKYVCNTIIVDSIAECSSSATTCTALNTPVPGCVPGKFACSKIGNTIDECFEYEYELIIKPGTKIIQNSSTILCEYECLEQNSIENSCPSNRWREVFCFDFASVESIQCPTCFADDVDYNLDVSDCGIECLGNVTLDHNSLIYTNIFTGAQAFSYESDNIILGSFGEQTPCKYLVECDYNGVSISNCLNLGLTGNPPIYPGCVLDNGFLECEDSYGRFFRALIDGGEPGEYGVYCTSSAGKVSCNNNLLTTFVQQSCTSLYRQAFPSSTGDYFINVDDINHVCNSFSIDDYLPVAQCVGVDTTQSTTGERLTEILCAGFDPVEKPVDFLRCECLAAQNPLLELTLDQCADMKVSYTPEKAWPLSRDCILSASCSNPSSGQYQIEITSVHEQDTLPTTEEDCEAIGGDFLYTGVCEIAKVLDTLGMPMPYRLLTVQKFGGCPISAGTYTFYFSEDTPEITIQDIPSQQLLKSVIGGSVLMSETYKVFPTECDPATFSVILEPYGTSEVYSKMVRTSPGGLLDKGFSVKINNRASDSRKINLRVCEGDCP